MSRDRCTRSEDLPLLKSLRRCGSPLLVPKRVPWRRDGPIYRGPDLHVDLGRYSVRYTKSILRRVAENITPERLGIIQGLNDGVAVTGLVFSVSIHRPREGVSRCLSPCVAELYAIEPVSNMAQGRISSRDGWFIRIRRTFSRPKNLSDPSSRTGPAFWRSFSSGVVSAGGSSFFLVGDAPPIACTAACSEHHR